MELMAKVERLTIPKDKRVICISDIHGSLDLFKQLLDKVYFSDGDILILLGDFYTKGNQGRETLKFVMELYQKPNVYAIRGNSDWIESYLETSEKEWLENLPHIIETKDYIFVHGGLTSDRLDKQEAEKCMKNDAFMEQGLSFDRYIITGHWPTVNYCHKIPCYNPIINKERKIIAIDGGMNLKITGQLNAFIISGGKFSFESVDDLPVYVVEKTQEASGGNLNITWNDRFIELIEEHNGIGIYRHLATGIELSLPSGIGWIDGDGNLGESNFGTDYFLPLALEDTVSVVKSFGSRFFAKKDGVAGWVGENCVRSRL